jgi:flagellin
MALRINYNQASIGAQQSLGRTQSAFEQAVGRLSSGLRINKAADDAAGLAVSEKLKNQVRGLNQAHRNAQDAVSLLQTAEGALTETQGLLARMRELAVQSANDTLTNNDRVHIQNEVNQLVSEIDRIAQSTQYNQISLLNKNSAVSLHNSGDALQFHVGANTNLVSGATAVTSGDNALQFSVPAGRAQDLGDVKTLNASRGIAGGAKTFTVDGNTVQYDASVDTVFDVRDAINASGAGVTATVANGRLTLSKNASFTVTGDTGGLVADLTIGSPAAGAVTGSTLISDIGAGSGSFYITDGATGFETIEYGQSGVLTLSDLAAAMNTALSSLGVASPNVAVTGSAFTFTQPTGISIGDSAPPQFGFGTTQSSPPGPNVAWPSTATPMVTTTFSAVSPVLSGATSLVSGTGGTVAVGSQTSANASISVLDAAIESVSSSRGSIGALQNRLLSAMNNLGVASENTAAANSRIRDADVAQAVSEMTRTQILQQSTMAVLAQANQSPFSVVQLLK